MEICIQIHAPCAWWGPQLVWAVWRREECRPSTGIGTANCPARGLVTVLITLSRLVLVEGVLSNVGGLYSLVINYELGLMRVTEEIRVGGRR
jgi:hypothetical protein